MCETIHSLADKVGKIITDKMVFHAKGDFLKMRIKKHKHELLFCRRYQHKNGFFFIFGCHSNPIFQQYIHFDGARQRKRDNEQRTENSQMAIGLFYELPFYHHLAMDAFCNVQMKSHGVLHLKEKAITV